MKHFSRSAIATAALVVFVVSAALAGLAWPVFWVPGALLIWYGVMAGGAEPSKIAVQQRARSGLN